MEAGAATTTASAAPANNGTKNNTTISADMNANASTAIHSEAIYFNYFPNPVVFKPENSHSSHNSSNNSTNSNHNRSIISKFNSKIKSLEKQKLNGEIFKFEPNSVNTSNNKNQLNLKLKINPNDSSTAAAAYLYNKSLLKQKQIQAEFVLPKLEATANSNKSIKLSELKETSKPLLGNANRVSSSKTSRTESTTTSFIPNHNTANNNNNNNILKENINQNQHKVNAILVDLNQQSLEAMTILSNEAQKNLYYQIVRRQSNSNNNLFANIPSFNNNGMVYPNKTVCFQNAGNSTIESSTNPFATSNNTSTQTGGHSNGMYTNSNLLGEIKVSQDRFSLVNAFNSHSNNINRFVNLNTFKRKALHSPEYDS
jgi:hypothetical protein